MGDETISFRPTKRQQARIEAYKDEHEDANTTEAVRHLLGRGIDADDRIDAIQGDLEAVRRERDRLQAEFVDQDASSGEPAVTVGGFALALATLSIFTAGLGILGVWSSLQADLVSGYLLVLAAVALLEANAHPIQRGIDWLRTLTTGG